MEAGILAAIISAVVSLLVTLITVFVSKSTIKAEREKLERELQRSMTTKLYEVRLESYPRAMEITEKLQKSRLTEQKKGIVENYFKDVLYELDTWHATKAAFIISHDSLNKFHVLRKLLVEKPESNGRYSSEQITRIHEAKTEFRAALRADIQLLFKEDEAEEVYDD